MPATPQTLDELYRELMPEDGGGGASPATTPAATNSQSLDAAYQELMAPELAEEASREARNRLFPEQAYDEKFQNVTMKDKHEAVNQYLREAGWKDDSISSLPLEQKDGLFKLIVDGERVDRDNDERVKRNELPRLGGNILAYHLNRAAVLPFQVDVTPEKLKDAREDINTFSALLRTTPEWKTINPASKRQISDALTTSVQRLADMEQLQRITPEDLSLFQESMRSAIRHYQVGWARGIGGAAQMLGANRKEGWAADLVTGAAAAEQDPTLIASRRASESGMNLNRAVNVFTDGTLSIAESLLPAAGVGAAAKGVGLSAQVALRTGQAASLGMMGTTAAGQTFSDVYKTLENNPDLTERQKYWRAWAGGAIAGAFESGSELIPFEAYQKKLVGRVLGEANDRAATIAKTKLIDYIHSAAMAHQSEWWSENISNVGGNIADAIKADPQMKNIVGESWNQIRDQFAQGAADNAVATAGAIFGGAASHASEVTARSLTSFMEKPADFLKRSGVNHEFISSAAGEAISSYMQTGDRKALETVQTGLLRIAAGDAQHDIQGDQNTVKISAMAAARLIDSALETKSLQGTTIGFGDQAMTTAAKAAKPSDVVRVESMDSAAGRPSLVWVSINGDIRAAKSYASQEEADAAVKDLSAKIETVQRRQPAAGRPSTKNPPATPKTSPDTPASAAVEPVVTRAAGATTAAQEQGTARDPLPDDRRKEIQNEFSGRSVSTQTGEWKVTGIDEFGDLEMLGPRAKRDTWTRAEFDAHDRAAGETPVSDPQPVLSAIQDPNVRAAAAALEIGTTLTDPRGRTWRYDGLATRGLVYQQTDTAGAAVGRPRLLPFTAAANPAAEFAAKPVAIPSGAPAFTAESAADPNQLARGRVAVVSADDLTGGTGLQERDRTRAASQAQVETIKSRFSPRRLITDTGTSDTGAPLIDADHRILGGYGRRQAMADLYASHDSARKDGVLVTPPAGVSPDVRQRWEQAAAAGETGDPRILAYHDAIRAAGFDPSATAHPVLARVAESFENASPESFAANTNARSTLGMGHSEQALADAKILSTPGMLNGFEPQSSLRAAANAQFASAFAATANDTAVMFDRDGRLNAAGEARLSRAMVAALLSGNPDAIPALDALFENGTDPASAKLLAALTAAGPDLLKTCLTNPDYDLRPALARAIPEAIGANREIGTGKTYHTAEDWYHQPNLIGGATEEVRELAWYLVVADSAKRLQAVFSAYSGGVKHAVVANATPDMFGTPETAAPDLLAVMRSATAKEGIQPSPYRKEQSHASRIAQPAQPGRQTGRPPGPAQAQTAENHPGAAGDETGTRPDSSAGQDAVQSLITTTPTAPTPNTVIPTAAAILEEIAAAQNAVPEMITVRDRLDELPEDVVSRVEAARHAAGAAGQPKGFYLDGKIYIIASAHSSLEDARGTVAHELLGHAAMHNLLGRGGLARLARVMQHQSWWTAAATVVHREELGGDTTDIRQRWSANPLFNLAVQEIRRGGDAAKIADEILAESARLHATGAFPQPGFIPRIVAMIRGAMARLGLPVKLGEPEILRILAQGKRTIQTATMAETRKKQPQPELYSAAVTTNGATLHSSTVGAANTVPQNTRTVNPKSADDLPRFRVEEMVRTLRYARGSTMAIQAAKDFLNKPITNHETGISVTVSRESLGKMTSESAVSRSHSPQAHMQAVANLDKLFPLATERGNRNDRKNNPNITKIHHFVMPMPFEGNVVLVKMMAKQFAMKEHGTRLYLVQTVEIAKPTSSLGDPTSSSKTAPVSDPLVGFTRKLASLVSDVKTAMAKHPQSASPIRFREADRPQRELRSFRVGSTGITAANGTYTRIPQLRMSGQWLRAAGFTPGMKTVIHAAHGQIDIRAGAAPEQALDPAAELHAFTVQHTMDSHHLPLDQQIPRMELRGPWMERNGFTTGATIDAKIEPGRILLTQRDATGAAAWPASFPQITPMTNAVTLRNHPDYAAAKSGDPSAAVRLAVDLIPQEKLLTLKRKYPEAIIVPVMAEERQGTNQIPHASATYIGMLNGWQTERAIIQTNMVGHTGAGAAARMAIRPTFDGPVKKGAAYVLVDDMATQGGTLSELRQFIERGGGKVVHAITLGYTSHPVSGNSLNLAIKPDTLLALNQKWGYTNVHEFLQRHNLYGGNPSALTNSEGRWLLSQTPESAGERLAAAKDAARRQDHGPENGGTAEPGENQPQPVTSPDPVSPPAPTPSPASETPKFREADAVAMPLPGIGAADRALAAARAEKSLLLKFSAAVGDAFKWGDNVGGRPAILNRINREREGSLIALGHNLERGLRRFNATLSTVPATTREVVDQMIRGQITPEVAREELDQKNSLTAAAERALTIASDMRENIDELSREIVASGLAQGMLADVIINNQGKYVVRAYRKYTDPAYIPSDADAHAAETYLLARIGDHVRRVEDLLERIAGRYVREGNRMALLNFALTGDTKFLKGQSNQFAHRARFARSLIQSLHDTYGSLAAAEIDADARRATITLNPATVDDTVAATLDVIRTKHTKEDPETAAGAATGSSRGFRVYDQIFKRRQDIPAEIRRYMGEIEDTTQILQLTLSRMEQALINHRALTRLLDEQPAAENDPARLFIAGDKPRFITGTDGQDRAFVARIPDTRAWGPLRGLWTTKKNLEYLRTGIEGGMQSQFAFRAWVKFNAALRWTKTIPNPGYHIRNMLGNFKFALAEGEMLHAPSYAIGWKQAAGLFARIAGKDQTTADAAWNEYLGHLRSGLLSSPTREGELRAALISGWGELDAASTTDAAGFYRRLAIMFKRGNNRLMELAQLTDGIHKLASYHAKLARGISAEQALEDVRAAYPYYDMAPEAATRLAKYMPFFEDFLTFKSEVLRTTVNNYTRAYQDLSAGRTADGLARLSGILSATTLGASITGIKAGALSLAAVYILNLLRGRDDKDKDQPYAILTREEEDAMRALQPETNRYNETAYWKAPDGTLYGLDLTFVDSHSLFAKAANVVTLHPPNATLGGRLSAIAGEFVGAPMAMQTAAELALDKNARTGESVWNDPSWWMQRFGPTWATRAGRAITIARAEQPLVNNDGQTDTAGGQLARIFYPAIQRQLDPAKLFTARARELSRAAAAEKVTLNRLRRDAVNDSKQPVTSYDRELERVETWYETTLQQRLDQILQASGHWLSPAEQIQGLRDAGFTKTDSTAAITGAGIQYHEPKD